MDLNTITIADFNDHKDALGLKYCASCKAIRLKCDFYLKAGGHESICKLCKKSYRDRKKLSMLLLNINRRCSGASSYIQKGIRNYLTLDQLETIWNRDKAWLLKKPSLDRVDNDGHYQFENCRFIEHAENSAKDKFKKVCQISKDGEVLNEFSSIKDAAIKTGTSPSKISAVCSGKNKTSNGYLWSFV